jgi:hypothetical protein
MLLRNPLNGEPFYRRNREFHAVANQFPERSDTNTLIVQEGFDLLKKNSVRSARKARQCSSLIMVHGEGHQHSSTPERRSGGHLRARETRRRNLAKGKS